MCLQLGTVYADGLNAGYSPNILSSLTGKVSGLDVKTASTGEFGVGHLETDQELQSWQRENMAKCCVVTGLCLKN